MDILLEQIFLETCHCKQNTFFLNVWNIFIYYYVKNNVQIITKHNIIILVGTESYILKQKPH